MKRPAPHDMGQPDPQPLSSEFAMLSVVIPTHESERALVATLACLVPGATAGLVREVIVTDAGSTDETAKVADIAGCRFMPLPGPPGARLSAAVRTARGPWLLFLPPGAVLDSGWVAEVERFLIGVGEEGAPTAAVFRPQTDAAGSLASQVFALLREALGGGPQPDHGLLLTKAAYDALGGHAADSSDPVGDPLRRLIDRIGRRKIIRLNARVSGLR